MLPSLSWGISCCRLPADGAAAVHENRTSLGCDHAVLWSVNTGVSLGPLDDWRTVDSTRVVVVTLDALSVPVCGSLCALCRLARAMAAGLEKREKFIKPSVPPPSRVCLVAANSVCCGGSGLVAEPGTGMRWLSVEGSGSLLTVAIGVLLLLVVCWIGGGKELRLVAAAAAAWSSEKKSGL